MKTRFLPATSRPLFVSACIASFGLVSSQAAVISWTGTSGNWSDTTWSGGVSPDGIGAEVAINVAGATVDLASTSRTVGSLNIGNTTPVTVSSTGGGNLIFNAASGNATLTMATVNSSNTISSGVTLNSSLDVTVGATTSTRLLILGGKVTGTGAITVKNSVGKFQLNNSANDFGGGVTIETGGTLSVATGGSYLGTGNLTINGGAIQTASSAASLNVGGTQIWAGNFTTATGSGNLNMGSSAVSLNGGTRTVTLNTNFNRSTTVGGVISNGGLAVANTGTFKSSLILTGANTYAGGSTVNSGILATSTTGAFGTGNVTVADAAGLTLGNASSLADTAKLTFGNSTIALNFTGTETLGELYSSITSTYMTAGSNYDAAALNAFFGGTYFTGSGLLTVTGAIPEPSTYAVIVGMLALGGSALVRRRRAAAVNG